MDIFHLSERLMGMDTSAWARHANPWSVYTRILGGSGVFLAFWSPFWIGAWSAAVIGAACVWTWLDPRLFDPPSNTENRASRAVLGERVFLNRRQVTIPTEHRRVVMIAVTLASAFIGCTVIAFAIRDFWLACACWHAATMAKVWFCDRMAWLWDDVGQSTDEYRAWSRADWGSLPIDRV